MNTPIDFSIYDMERFLSENDYSYYIEREPDNFGNTHKITYNIRTIKDETYSVVYIKSNNRFSTNYRFNSKVPYIKGLHDAIFLQNITRDKIEIVHGDNLFVKPAYF